ncbi:UNVERIFIED_CONTAM: hypothetical protein RMT77_006477 [Armadillidium vulgare]
MFLKIQWKIYPFERYLINYFNSTLASYSTFVDSETYFHPGLCINNCSSLLAYRTVKNKQRNVFYSQYRFISVWIPNNIWINEICRKKFENPYEEALRKRKSVSIKIQVRQENGETSVMTLDQANTLGFKKDLKLVKVDDPLVQQEGNLPLYQLISGKKYHEEFSKTKSEKKQRTVKDEKILEISGNIGKADLETKIKKIFSILQKKCAVKVVIEDEKEYKLEKVYSHIEEAIAGKGKIGTQKATNKIILRILPVEP